MARKTSRDTRGRIIAAAWQLFYEQGYEETTIDEIVEESGTSKGSFYHYFRSKDDLLGTLSDLFDRKYEELEPEIADIESCYDKLIVLNRELFTMIENSISQDLLARLLGSQLLTRGEKYLLDRNRYYYKLLRKICIAGQDSGEFTDSISVNEMVKLYAVLERAFLYDWCICNGEYSLRSYGTANMSEFLRRFLGNNPLNERR